GQRILVGGNLNYRVQPWGNFAISANYNQLKFPDNFGEETLWLIGPRAEVNFSKNLFWTTFLQYNTQADNFNINSRLQWQFRPLSWLFLVYSDNYAVDVWGPKNRALVLKVNYWLVL
ncbi:MAG: hydrolase, partial [Bacteroidota bacterium]